MELLAGKTSKPGRAWCCHKAEQVNHEQEALNPAEKGRKCSVTAEVLRAPKTSLNILASFTTSDITHVFLYVASAEGLMRENN